MNDLAHDMMTCIRSDVECGCFNMTLCGESPLVVVGREFRDGILAFGSSDDGMECFGSIVGFCCADCTG